LIRFNLIKVEPQNPAGLSFWRETCPKLNSAALIPKLDAEPAVHWPFIRSLTRLIER
jgi:hypothetical protein